VYGIDAHRASVSAGLGYWLVMSEGGGATAVRNLLSSDVSTVLNSTITFGYQVIEHTRILGGTGGDTYHYGDSALYRGHDNLQTYNTVQTAGGFSYNGQVAAIDPSGLLIMSYNSVDTPWKSSDGGYSFSSVGSVPVLQSWGFVWASNTDVKSKWIGVSSGGYIYFTEDFWTTTKDKRGNVVTISPIPHFDLVSIL